MSSHKIKLQQDLINTLGNAINPLTTDEVLHEVTNSGFKQQRIYVDSEILEVLEYLVQRGYVTKNGDCYEWNK